MKAERRHGHNRHVCQSPEDKDDHFNVVALFQSVVLAKCAIRNNAVINCNHYA